mgnify:CR=1 FL=1
MCIKKILKKGGEVENLKNLLTKSQKRSSTSPPDTFHIHSFDKNFDHIEKFL